MRVQYGSSILRASFSKSHCACFFRYESLCWGITGVRGDGWSIYFPVTLADQMSGDAYCICYLVWSVMVRLLDTGFATCANHAGPANGIHFSLLASVVLQKGSVRRTKQAH